MTNHHFESLFQLNRRRFMVDAGEQPSQESITILGHCTVCLTLSTSLNGNESTRIYNRLSQSPSSSYTKQNDTVRQLVKSFIELEHGHNQKRTNKKCLCLQACCYNGLIDVNITCKICEWLQYKKNRARLFSDVKMSSDEYSMVITRQTKVVKSIKFTAIICYTCKSLFSVLSIIDSQFFDPYQNYRVTSF